MRRMSHDGDGTTGWTEEPELSLMMILLQQNMYHYSVCLCLLESEYKKARDEGKKCHDKTMKTRKPIEVLK